MTTLPADKAHSLHLVLHQMMKEPLSVLCQDDAVKTAIDNLDTLQHILCRCIQMNDTINTHWLLTNTLLKTKLDLNNFRNMLLDITNDNALDFFIYLTSSPELSSHLDIEVQKGEILRIAARFNDINIVRYVTSSPLLPKHLNVNDNHGEAFIQACQYGSTQVIRYFTEPNSCTYPLETFGTDILERGLIYACEYGNIDIVQHLIEKTSCDVNDVFGEALTSSYTRNQKDIVHYLLSCKNVQLHDIHNATLYHEIYEAQNLEFIVPFMKFLYHNEFLFYLEIKDKVEKHLIKCQKKDLLQEWRHFESQENSPFLIEESLFLS